MDILQYFGHFHPLILHLPIGFLLLAFAMEVKDRWTKQAKFSAAVNFSLLLGMISAIIAACTGYLLSLEGGYEEQLLWNHQMLGIGVAVLSILLYVLNQLGKTGIVYITIFTGTTLLLLAAGHYGGSLTHGDDFLSYNVIKANSKRNSLNINVGPRATLTGLAATTKAAKVDLKELLVFQDLVAPILKEKCYTCHKNSKRKGELIMSTKEGLKKGGKSGALFVAGDPDNSLLLKRIHLPLEVEEHMPPSGKRQLVAEEVALLKWWIQEVATFDKKIGALTTDTTLIKELLKKKTAVSQEDNNLMPKKTTAITSLKKMGIPVFPYGVQNSFLEVDLSNRQDLDGQVLAKLVEIKEQLISLNLANSNISDTDLEQIGNFPKLQKLFLQQTSVTDKGLKLVSQLGDLQYLNLYSTAITDEGLKELEKLANLQRLFLWQTKTTIAGVNQLKTSKPQMSIDMGVDDNIFSVVPALKKPLVTVLNEENVDKHYMMQRRILFKDKLEVSLSFNMNLSDVKVYYTLDGKKPDANATLYKKPITVTQTTRLQAIAIRKGWLPGLQIYSLELLE